MLHLFKETEKKFDGPKLRIETLSTEGASIKPSVKPPTTPTPILHKDTQLIPLELLDASLRDPRLSKGFITSSVYHDIASRAPLVFPICTQATADDGSFICCSDLIPWKVPLKVDLSKSSFNKFPLEALPSLALGPEMTLPPSKPAAPARPTDPRKRSGSATTKSLAAAASSPKPKTSPVFERTLSPNAVAGSFANSPTSILTEEPNFNSNTPSPSSKTASPTFEKSYSINEGDEKPPNSPDFTFDIYNRMNSSEQFSYNPPSYSTDAVNSLNIKSDETAENEASMPVSPDKPSPSGLTPFVLPTDSLSPKMDMDKLTEFGKYSSSKPKASLSIAEYMKRRRTKPNETLSGDFKQDGLVEADGDYSSDDKIDESVENSQNNYLEYDSNAMPSIKDLFKDPTASPFG